MVETTAQPGWPGPGGVQSGAFVLKHDPLLLLFLLPLLPPLSLLYFLPPSFFPSFLSSSPLPLAVSGWLFLTFQRVSRCKLGIALNGWTPSPHKYHPLPSFLIKTRMERVGSLVTLIFHGSHIEVQENKIA